MMTEDTKETAMLRRKPLTVRVRARWPGYYRGHRREGEAFDFVSTAAAELPKWLAPVDAPAAASDEDAAKAAPKRAKATRGRGADDAAEGGARG